MKTSEFIAMKPVIESYCDKREKILEERKKDIPFAARYLEGRLDEVRSLRNLLNIVMVTQSQNPEVEF